MKIAYSFIRVGRIGHVGGVGAVLLAAGCSSNLSEGAAQTGEQEINVGGTYQLETLAHPTSCMDVSGGAAADGTQIQEWGCNGSAAQVFQIQSAGAGVFTLINPHAGKCVDVKGSGTADGTKVELWDCNGTAAQTFRIQDAGAGNVTFVNPNSGRCLDVSASNPADGTHVQLWDCNGTSAQAWTRVPLGGGTPDSGAGDAGAADSGAGDAGAADSGAGDSATADAGAADSGAADSAVTDAGASLPPGASDWLVPMNQARALVGEAPFVWDPIAAAVAQSWASQCSFGHNPAASGEYDNLGGSGGLGEDVAAGAPSQSVADAVASWVNERQSYDHATNSCVAGQVCGHYTQIVWKSSTAVGCAQVHCTQNSPFGAGFPKWDMSVCDFNPPGNFVGESPY